MAFRAAVNRRIAILAAAVAIAAALAAARGAETGPSGQAPQVPARLTLYTSSSATCPQMPLFSALASGRLSGFPELEIKIWKNLDDLRGLILAGRGDVWLGGIETFARAASLKAPVSLLAVTGWRKFYLISREESVHGFEDLAGRRLYYAPVGAPVAAVLKSLESRGLPTLNLAGLEPRQLSLMLLQKKVNNAVLPEPMVTALLEKDQGLRVAAGVAETAGRLTGGPPRIPWAGLAVNSRLTAEHPEHMKQLVQALVDEAGMLAENPEPGIASLPREFEAGAERGLILKSLKRDLILVKPAAEARLEINTHLHLVAPDLFDEAGTPNLPQSFIWGP